MRLFSTTSLVVGLAFTLGSAALALAANLFPAAPLLRAALFISATVLLTALLFYKRFLPDPSSVIPDRVRAMLDALAEGVIIMDNNQQVMMANEAFCRIAQSSQEKIQGRRLTDLAWLALADGRPDQKNDLRPWVKKIKDGIAVRREAIHISADPERQQPQRTLVINAVPIHGTSGARRGILVTFDDVTTVEAANDQLRKALDELAKSQEEISRKNRELEVLAARDPLTGCMNRRSFLRAFEDAWAVSKAGGKPLACIMLDLDHFKQVNDQYGHVVGDQVLKQMGMLLQNTSRGGDLVCRYGGEEFCLLLPNTGFEDAHVAAERIRQRVADAIWPINKVTTSIGVSGIEAGANDPRQLIEQADKSLYAAKRSGRNKVIPWGDPAIDTAPVPVLERRGHVPSAQLRQIVDVLFSALKSRDPATAEHSRRVSETVCSIAEERWGSNDAEMLRLAALLHDLGKLAIPDSILKKAGPLTAEEWQLMHQHESLGADMILQATGNAALTDIVRYHHAWFGGTRHDPGLPAGTSIPGPCRLLLIADAYDALVSDRCYRKGTSHEEAAAELRRCAGTQFDPDLVEAFLAQVDRTRRSPDMLISRLNSLSANDAAEALASLHTGISDLSAQAEFALASPDKPQASQWDPLESTCRHASLSIL